MREFKIRKKEENQVLVFEVVVEEGGSPTTHIVTLNKNDFNRMNPSTGSGQVSPEELVRKSFEFLLQA